MANANRIRLWYRALLKATDQTRECLKDENGRCCLGVACDVYKQNTGKGYWEDNDGALKFQGEGDTLPLEVQEWFGLESCDPYLNHDGLDKTASSLNDSEKLSFREIAECVRDTYLRNE